MNLMSTNLEEGLHLPPTCKKNAFPTFPIINLPTLANIFATCPISHFLS